MKDDSENLYLLFHLRCSTFIFPLALLLGAQIRRLLTDIAAALFVSKWRHINFYLQDDLFAPISYRNGQVRDLRRSFVREERRQSVQGARQRRDRIRRSQKLHQGPPEITPACCAAPLCVEGKAELWLLPDRTLIAILLVPRLQVTAPAARCLDFVAVNLLTVRPVPLSSAPEYCRVHSVVPNPEPHMGCGRAVLRWLSGGSPRHGRSVAAGDDPAIRA